jgi:hypothetical protein
VLVVKALRRSDGEVFVIEGGPSIEVDAHHTSRRPQELRMSSIRVKVSSSEDVL